MASCHSWCFKTCDIVVGSIWEHEWSLVRLSLVRGLWILFLALVCMGWVLCGVECVRWGGKGNDDNRLCGEDGESSERIPCKSWEEWIVWRSTLSLNLEKLAYCELVLEIDEKSMSWNLRRENSKVENWMRRIFGVEN